MRLHLLPCLLIAVACHGDPVAPPPTTPVAGLWVGVIGTEPIVLTLTEAGGAIAGTGTLAATPIAVTGQYNPPAVGLTFTASGFVPVTVQAVVSETVIGGVASGGGYPFGTPIALSRQSP